VAFRNKVGNSHVYLSAVTAILSKVTFLPRHFLPSSEYILHMRKAMLSAVQKMLTGGASNTTKGPSKKAECFEFRKKIGQFSS
jgi:hypothetical protein